MDAISYSGMLDANDSSFGLRALPTYNFDKADVIVSFGADFLGNWLNVDYASAYAAARNPKSGKMAKHYQVESTLSLTGSNADERVQIKPSEQAGLLSNLYSALNGGSADGNGYVDFLSNGFKLKTGNIGTEASGTFVYIAFAESPFVNSNGVPNNAR